MLTYFNGKLQPFHQLQCGFAGYDELQEGLAVLAEFFSGGFKQAVRYGNWKAVKIKGEMELYDLSKDIGEENNVVNENPGIVEIIEDYLFNCRTESPFWPVKRE